MTEELGVAKPGFQGSQLSGVEVTVYRQDGDPIILSGAGERGGDLILDGSRPSDPHPALTSVMTSKTMGAPSGQWTVTMKPSRATREIFDQILDDDWVDITFKIHNRSWHVMRGLVDNTRRQRGVANGATTETFVVTGRDFGKIWEVTPIWFSVLVDDASGITGGVHMRVFGTPNLLGAPQIAVQGYLKGFLDILATSPVGGIGRAVWKMPVTMPGLDTDQRFIQNVEFDLDDDKQLPARNAINPNYMMTEGTLWQLAQEWSDPEFMELFCDTMSIDWRTFPLQETTPADTSMVLVYRDRPFPTMEDQLGAPYFSLPVYTVPRQAIVDYDVGRTGLERYNAFFVAPQMAQEVLQAGGIDIYQPDWHKDDILRHGLRRFDVNSRYVPADANILGFAETQRVKARDWHCLNPYFLNGTINLAVGMPWIRIGNRLLIPGIDGPENNETYYIESVTHNWVFGTGTRTSIGVTRGWKGEDNDLIDALDDLTSGYGVPTRARPYESQQLV